MTRVFFALARVFICLPLVAACVVRADAPIVHVDRSSVALDYKSFPLGHPPPHLAASSEREAGFCQYAFGCVTLAHGQLHPNRRGPTDVAIDSIDVDLTLSVTVWTGNGTGPEVRAHEETHRAICEHYYRDADEISRRIVRQALPEKIAVTGDNKAAEADAAIRAVQKKIVAAFMAEVQERCDFAQDRFDAITDHGRASIKNEAAMKQALDDEQTHWRTLPRPPSPP